MMQDQLLLFRLPEQQPVKKLLADPADGEALAGLIALAGQKGWQGNLWHCALTDLLLESENPYSLAAERRTAADDSLRRLALLDMEVFRSLFDKTFDGPVWEILRDFHAETSEASEEFLALTAAMADAGSAEAMLKALSDFYAAHGVGMFGLHQVFRLDEAGQLCPVENRRSVRLEDLVGYETQKSQLVGNTEAFCRGQGANNVLLYGDAGTGKSTSVQAVSARYAPEGLRLIELTKAQFAFIPALFARIKHRNYRFLLLLDDLSFEEHEVDYKYLKAALEGGAEATPENIRIYATSNRRHLVREDWNDRSDMEHHGDIHRSDTMEEKLSLSSRFGLQIFYPNPSFEEYHAIVRSIAKREGVQMDEKQLAAAASTYQVRRGSRSGRTAQQFVQSLHTTK